MRLLEYNRDDRLIVPQPRWSFLYKIRGATTSRRYHFDAFPRSEPHAASLRLQIAIAA